ncbi:MAG: sugar ABC transporter permease [Chloroflexi bacterium]|nr:sugar ABC transporter permease [Chloroflexota bacterium]
MESVQQAQPQNLRQWLEIPTIRTIVSIVGFALAVIAFIFAFNFLRSDEAPIVGVIVVGLVVGILGIWVLFLSLDALVDLLPPNAARAVRPFVYLAPGLAALGAFLVYPAFYTLFLSFFAGRPNFQEGTAEFIGLENYLFRRTAEAPIFSEEIIWIIVRNNLMWIVLVTFLSVALGLVIAVLVDRIKLESVAKSLIFMPMAISFVGASVIWRFIYYFQPLGREQIGLLNAIWVALGGEPQGWLTLSEVSIPLITNLTNGTLFVPLNSIFLIIIMVWLQTGFAMVIISAAVKGVPDALLEAARLDGANEVQIFFRIIIPYIRGTLLTVGTTILVLVLKVFDIVFVMTSGDFDTEVLANRMYIEMFTNRDYGQGSAYAVILMVAVIPIMIYNIREWQRERQER